MRGFEWERGERNKGDSERGRRKRHRKRRRKKKQGKTRESMVEEEGRAKRRSLELPQFISQSGSLKTILKKSKSISHSSKMVSTNQDMAVFCFDTLVAHYNSEQPPPPAFDEAQQYFSSTHFYFLLFIVFGVLL